MAVKTDMSKAYDRLEWDFIQAVFERLGFHQQWITWIMQCVKTVTYSFLLNGQAKGLVLPERGIRQGDPLSPYLFILCSEVLSSLCNKAQVHGSLTGLRVARGSPRVNHLLFADDTMFFCRSDLRSCGKLQEILQKYERASGQQISKEKSAITFSSRTQQEIKDQAKRILGIQKEGGQGKYLGLPELFGRKKKDLFSLIIDRIKQRALSWSSRFLSSAGKMTLLKSVLAAMPTYTMTCFQLPSSMHKRIQSALTRFWWDANSEKKKMSWISWKRMTLSFKKGGLGFRDISTFNAALLAKISWRILTKPSCLLARVLLGKYCHNSPFLKCFVPAAASHGWRSICVGRDLLKPYLGKIIGSGATTSVWNSPWLSLTEALAPMGPPTAATQDLTVADLRHPVTLEWNLSLIREVLPQYESTICKLKPSKTGADDIWAWLPNKTGEYSARSGYFEAYRDENTQELGSLQHLPDFNWRANIWALKSSPKTKLLLWKASQNALPVGENLRIRKINDSVACAHCGLEESATHLFFTCSFAQQVWINAPVHRNFNPNRIHSIQEGISIGAKLTCLPPSGVGDGPLFPWLMWSIWSARNQLIFNQKQIPSEEVLLLAILRAKEWQEAQRSILKIQITFPPLAEPLSEFPPIQCSTDASWTPDGRAGLGWVFKNRQDSIVLQGSAVLTNIASPLMAEALATLHAVEVAIASAFSSLSFASDSLLLVKALNSDLPHVEIHGICYDILHLSSSFCNVAFNFISRDKNRYADALAKEALCLSRVPP